MHLCDYVAKKQNQYQTIKENLDLYNSTKKRQHYFDILKAFFIRQSSEYKISDSDRKVNRNIYPDAVTHDRMHLIDPKSGQLEPIHHCCLVEELKRKCKLFLSTCCFILSASLCVVRPTYRASHRHENS